MIIFYGILVRKTLEKKAYIVYYINHRKIVHYEVSKKE